MEKHDEQATILSAELDPLAMLAGLSNEERLQALWRREGIVRKFAPEYRRELIAEASEHRIRKAEADDRD